MPETEISEHEAILVMRCQEKRAETGQSWSQCVLTVATELDISTDEVWKAVKTAISVNARR